MRLATILSPFLPICILKGQFTAEDDRQHRRRRGGRKESSLRPARTRTRIYMEFARLTLTLSLTDKYMRKEDAGNEIGLSLFSFIDSMASQAVSPVS